MTTSYCSSRFFWFSSPPLLKKWLDDVLTYGWAYGSRSGYKMQNKKLALAVTAGVRAEDYARDGRYRYSLEEIFRPFEVTAGYVQADYASFFAFYGKGGRIGRGGGAAAIPRIGSQRARATRHFSPP